jgi:hypothetical protein
MNTVFIAIIAFALQIRPSVVTVQTDKGSNKSRHCSFDIAYPVCSLPGTGPLNDSLSHYINHRKAAFMKYLATINGEFDFSKVSDNWFGVELKYTYVDTNVISYCLQIGTTITEGVPTTEYRAFNYDLHKRRFFLPTSFIRVPDSTVYSLILQGLNAIQPGCFDMEALKTIPVARIQTTLDANSLLFDYSADTIGSHGCGAPQVSVQKRALGWRLR